MKIRQTIALVVAALITIALAACGGGKKASTPTEAFKMFYEAAKGKDVPTLKRVMSKATLAGMEEHAKGQKISLDEFLSKESQTGLPPNIPETRNEKIEGDKATIEIKREGATSWSTASFVKEDGDWKVLLQ